MKHQYQVVQELFDKSQEPELIKAVTDKFQGSSKVEIDFRALLTQAIKEREAKLGNVSESDKDTLNPSSFYEMSTLDRQTVTTISKLLAPIDLDIFNKPFSDTEQYVGRTPVVLYSDTDRFEWKNSVDGMVEYFGGQLDQGLLKVIIEMFNDRPFDSEQFGSRNVSGKIDGIEYQFKVTTALGNSHLSGYVNDIRLTVMVFKDFNSSKFSLVSNHYIKGQESNGITNHPDINNAHVDIVISIMKEMARLAQLRLPKFETF